MKIVLVHGSWHDGSLMEPLARELQKLGHDTWTPTIAGHGKGADKKVGHAECVSSIADFIAQHDLRDIALFGHSFGGSVIQKVAEVMPDRISRLVFHNAFVLQDGESLVDTTPPHFQELWPNLVDEVGGLMLPFEVWRDAFIGDASFEDAKAAYEKLSATPSASHFDKIQTAGAHTLQVPKSYLFAQEDSVFPHGESFGWFPRFANRLGAYRTVMMNGSHEVCLTAPAELAAKVELAARP